MGSIFYQRKEQDSIEAALRIMAEVDFPSVSQRPIRAAPRSERNFARSRPSGREEKAMAPSSGPNLSFSQSFGFAFSRPQS
jgi:hypothetical protein